MSELPSLSLISNGMVSTANPPVAMPVGNTDTIVNALGPFFNKPEHDLIYGAASTGFFSYNEPSCGGAGINPGVGGQLATVGINQALNAIPIAGPLLSKIFGAVNPIAHHAAAVKTEQATLCQAVPDANNFLRGIDAAVAQGQIDTNQAAQVLEQGYTNWLVEVKGIIKFGAGKNCNAACVYAKAFRAAIEMRKLNYSIIAAQQGAGAQGVAGGVVNAVSSVSNVVGDAVNNVIASVKNILGTPSIPTSPFSLATHEVFTPAPGGTVAASVGGSIPLAQAGLTPARQSSLALVIVGAGIVLSIGLFLNLFGGSK